MVVPKKFRKSPESIVSFDFTDIASGAGLVQFYLYNSQADTTDQYSIVNNSTLFSDGVQTLGNLSLGGTFIKDIDIDFDVVFNKPQDVLGLGFANIFVDFTARNGDNVFFYVVLNLKHWDGATETSLVSVQSRTVGNSLAPVADVRQGFGLQFEITTPKHFRAGDTLRATIEIWGKGGTGSTLNRADLQHDPVSRSTANADMPGSSNILIPFRIDV